jgi:hypothetical protein
MLHFVFMSGRTTIYKIDYSLFVQLILQALQNGGSATEALHPGRRHSSRLIGSSPDDVHLV